MMKRFGKRVLLVLVIGLGVLSAVGAHATDNDGRAADFGGFGDGSVRDRALTGDGTTTLAIGGATCIRRLAFSDERLVVGGFARNGPNGSFALAAYPIDDAPRVVAFVAPAATVSEQHGIAMLQVRLDRTAAQPVTVQHAATGGSASNGADYLLAGTLTFAPATPALRSAFRSPMTTMPKPKKP